MTKLLPSGVSAIFLAALLMISAPTKAQPDGGLVIPTQLQSESGKTTLNFAPVDSSTMRDESYVFYGRVIEPQTNRAFFRSYHFTPVGDHWIMTFTEYGNGEVCKAKGLLNGVYRGQPVLDFTYTDESKNCSVIGKNFSTSLEVNLRERFTRNRFTDWKYVKLHYSG